jgi:hypothetical protein
MEPATLQKLQSGRLNTCGMWCLEKEVLHWVMLFAGRNSQTAAFWIFPMSRGGESNFASVLQSTCGRPKGHFLSSSTQVGGNAIHLYNSVIKMFRWVAWFIACHGYWTHFSAVQNTVMLHICQKWPVRNFLFVNNWNCIFHVGVTVAAERVSEPLNLYPKLMQLVVQEDFLSHVVAAKGPRVVFVCCAAEN